MLTVEEQLFKSLFHNNYELLCSYALKFVSDRDIAEDITQSFFITIWEKKNFALTNDNFLPYAYRSIKNACINHYKHGEWQENFLKSLNTEWIEQLQDEEEEEFCYSHQVQLALSKLPPKCKEAFMLKSINELKYKEIADIMGISVNTVKYHLTEAFRLMREELKSILSLFILFFI